MIETSPRNHHLGHARVSTYGQTLDAQLQHFRAEGCAKVYREKVIGAQTNRAQLAHVFAQLAKGDVLIVTRLDRVARSTRDLLNTLATIIGEGAGLRCLNDAWADTTTAHGMLTVLGGFAEFERELIRARACEGRARTVANGVKMGRKPKLTDHQKREAIKRRDHWRGDACGDWPRLQRVRLDDFEIGVTQCQLKSVSSITASRDHAPKIRWTKSSPKAWVFWRTSRN